MTILDWLVENMAKLQKAGADSPRRDCLVLLEDTLEKNRAWVISHPEYSLDKNTLVKLEKLINRRLKREPLAYIRQKAWFYGRIFYVSPKAMVPRPESEDFIEMLKEVVENNYPQSRKIKIVDMGTGSGCLAVTSKLELPDAEVVATDNDSAALEIARRNSEVFKTTIEFINSDLFNSLENFKSEQNYSNNNIVVLANLPYVPDGYISSPEIMYEPEQAIFSGKDGLRQYIQFWQQISNLLLKPQHVLTESLENQHEHMAELAQKSGYELRRTRTLIQYFEKSTR